jgi:hypothetical protein
LKPPTETHEEVPAQDTEFRTFCAALEALGLAARERALVVAIAPGGMARAVDVASGIASRGDNPREIASIRRRDIELL